MGAVPTCDSTEATVCITQIGSLGSDAAVALDLAVELDADSSVALDAGVCGAGGDGIPNPVFGRQGTPVEP